MLPNLFNNTTIPVLQEVLSFSQARHNVLAGNIANADTPGYLVRDLSVDTFQERLKEALTRQAAPREFTLGDVADREPDDAMREVRDSLKTILFLDGSNVGIEQQVTEVAKNQYLHNLTVSIMNSQFRLLQAAISERV
ncbi:MAG: flagellar basal body rod protein FlgB [Planctomycetaceae bacterium]|nr:flagellar basal body rod protein FlgB [Planctomycetaceae bacterium]